MVSSTPHFVQTFCSAIPKLQNYFPDLCKFDRRNDFNMTKLIVHFCEGDSKQFYHSTGSFLQCKHSSCHSLISLSGETLNLGPVSV